MAAALGLPTGLPLRHLTDRAGDADMPPSGFTLAQAIRKQLGVDGVDITIVQVRHRTLS